MRPIIMLGIAVLLIISIIAGYNITAPYHEDIVGTYTYGGTDFFIKSNSQGTYGNAQVSIYEVREENIFEMTSKDGVFPSGRYMYSQGNLIGLQNGVTFLRR